LAKLICLGHFIRSRGCPQGSKAPQAETLAVNLCCKCQYKFVQKVENNNVQI